MVSINGARTAVEVNDFLETLGRDYPQVRVFDKEICKLNAKGRNADKLLQDISRAEERPDTRAYGTVTELVAFLRTKPTIGMLAGSPEKVFEMSQLGKGLKEEAAGLQGPALVAHREMMVGQEREFLAGLAPWHTFAILYLRNQLFIFDPSYSNLGSDQTLLNPPAAGRYRQIGHFRNLHLARSLVKTMRGKRKLDTIWLGGEKMREDRCWDQTAAWMENIAMKLKGAKDELGIEQIFEGMEFEQIKE
ncbi:MAG: hypothetical protein M1819_001637 [Sarea resinae]|nr:MAG: hypothetical protein M1819_001637 [Sarea resinae]